MDFPPAPHCAKRPTDLVEGAPPRTPGIVNPLVGVVKAGPPPGSGPDSAAAEPAVTLCVSPTGPPEKEGASVRGPFSSIAQRATSVSTL